MARFVGNLLASATLWVRIQTSQKIIQNGIHKQRSGQHTLARQKKVFCSYLVEMLLGFCNFFYFMFTLRCRRAYFVLSPLSLTPAINYHYFQKRWEKAGPESIVTYLLLYVPFVDGVLGMRYIGSMKDVVWSIPPLPPPTSPTSSARCAHFFLSLDPLNHHRTANTRNFRNKILRVISYYCRVMKYKWF